MRHMICIKCNRTTPAHILASMGKTAPARLRDYITAYRTLVAGDINDLDHIFVGTIPAHCKLDAFP